MLNRRRFLVRLRPGGTIVIPRPILLALGGDAAKISIDVHANRLTLTRQKSPKEARLAKFKTRLARLRGCPWGNFFVVPPRSFRPSDDDKMLEGMIVQMSKTTASANAAIDRALASVEASNNALMTMNTDNLPTLYQLTPDDLANQSNVASSATDR